MKVSMKRSCKEVGLLHTLGVEEVLSPLLVVSVLTSISVNIYVEAESLLYWRLFSLDDDAGMNCMAALDNVPHRQDETNARHDSRLVIGMM